MKRRRNIKTERRKGDVAAKYERGGLLEKGQKT